MGVESGFEGRLKGKGTPVTDVDWSFSVLFSLVQTSSEDGPELNRVVVSRVLSEVREEGSSFIELNFEHRCTRWLSKS